MTSRLNQGAEGSITSPRLEALLDKLVAVQLDLDPISRSGGAGRRKRQGCECLQGSPLGNRGLPRNYSSSRRTGSFRRSVTSNRGNAPCRRDLWRREACHWRGDLV